MKKHQYLNIALAACLLLVSINTILCQTFEVGTLAGQPDVSASGAATYHIPIELPPGRAGMQPSLALMYNSQAAGNIIGQGWGLAGFSSVSRANPSQYYSNHHDDIDFEDDELILDGMHLIQVAEQNGNIIYRTEIDAIAKIIFHKETGALPWFEVKTKNGLTKEYGNSPTSRQVYQQGNEYDPLIWHLSRVYDQQNNMIEYTYLQNKSNGEIHPDLISYTKLKGSSDKGFYTVDFVYDNLDEELHQTAYYEKGGHKYLNKNTMRLRKITVLETGQEDVPIAEYLLDYFENKSITKEYFLKSVTLNSNGKPLKPTTFDWDFYQPGYVCDKIETEKDSLFNISQDGSLSMTAVDWDGNLEDEIAVCKTTIENNAIKTVLSFFNGNSETTLVLAEPGMIMTKLQAADLDMDSDEELIVNLDPGFKIFDILPAGSGFELQEVYHGQLTGDPNIGDFNGDGIPDCLLTRQDKARLLIGTGTGYEDLFTGDDSDEPDPPELIFESGYYFDCMADFNGDGVLELILLDKDSRIFRSFSFDAQNETFINHTSFYYPESYKQYFADFNGDGKTDICFAYKEENAYKGKIYYSYGNGYYSDEQKVRSLARQYPMIADLNNDNRADFIYFSTTTSYIFEYTKPDGLSYVSRLYNVDMDCFDIQAEHTIAATTLADLDGNGIKDLVIDFAETFEEPDEQPKNRIHMFTFVDAGFGSNAIRSITNGLGVTLHFDYQNISAAGAFFNPGYPLTKFRSPIHLIRETYVSGHEGQRMFQKKYSFRDPVLHLNGKGFLGFLKTSMFNEQTNTRTATQFEWHKQHIQGKDYYFHLYPSSTKQYYQGGGKEAELLIAHTENEIGIKQMIVDNPMVYLPVITESKTKTWDIDGSYIKTTKYIQQLSAIDIYGNSLEKKVLLDEADPEQDEEYQFSTTVNNQYYQNYELENWLVSRPDYTSITHKKLGETKDFHHKEYTYFPTGEEHWPLLKLVTQLPNGNKNLLTEVHLEYDQFGNVTRKTLKAPGFEIDNEPYPIEERIINYEFSDSDKNDSRFVTSKWTEINGSSFKTAYTYDPLSGNILSTQHPSLLTNTFEYNEMGRLKEATSPNGLKAYQIWGWAEGHEHEPQDQEASYYTSGFTIGAIETTEQEKTISFFDRFGKLLRSVRFGIDHSAIYIDRIYDDKARLLKVSEPYFSNQAASLWTEFSCDDLGRTVKTMLPNGNSISTEHHGRATITVDEATSVMTQKEINVLGKVIRIDDPTGSIEYGYFSSGKLKQVDALGVITRMTYNDAGFQTTIEEPNSGLTSIVYDPFGEIIRQVDDRGNSYELMYDKLGRLSQKKLTTPFEETTNYLYNDSPPVNENTGEGYGKLKSVVGPNGIAYHYGYDEFSRLTRQTEIIQDGASNFEFTSLFEYEENMGRLEKLTYPSGFKIGYDYAYNGRLSKVTDLTHNEPVWFDPLANAHGLITDYMLGNGLSTHKSFDQYGFPTEILTNHVQDLKYSFDPITANLNWRADSLFNLIEYFGYEDRLKSRLETWRVDKEMEYGIVYRDNGNILRKTDVTDPAGPSGTYAYDFQDKPHAVKKVIQPTQEYMSAVASGQRITYTPFNKVHTISRESDEETRKLSFVYGPDNGRKITRESTTMKGGTELLRTKYFISGNYEIEKDHRGAKRKLHYIYGGDGLCAILEMSEESEDMYYIHKDHLGSYHAITDQDGNVIERLGFDPWGRRRNPETWTFEDVAEDYKFDRGFTGHEHLDAFNLINMNGRVVDPWLGRFLSPDPFVQAAGNSQSYNRYSYAFNNPLKYVDPSGYWNDDFPRDIWMKYESMGRSADWHMMMGNSMINQYNNGRFQHAYGGVASLNSFMSSSGYVFLGKDQYVDKAGNKVEFNHVFNNYILPNSNNFSNEQARNLYTDISSEMNIYEISAFGNRTLVSSFGSIGSATVYENGGINFSNPTSSAYAGQAVIESHIIKKSLNSQIGDIKLIEDISFGANLELLIVGLASSGKQGLPVVARFSSVTGGIFGIVDNSYRSYSAFSKNHYYEGTYQATQAVAYATGTVMLFTPLMPIGASIIFVNSLVDLGEYFYKNW